MSRPVIILGGGGHARVLAELLVGGGTPVLGYTAPEDGGALAPGVGWLGDDRRLADYPPERGGLVNGIGSVGDTAARRRLFDRLRGQGYTFPLLCHPSAMRSPSAECGQGCQLMAGAILQAGARLGDNVLLNSRALVEHGCRIGRHTHIASGAVVCGDCEIGEGCHIGAGAVLIQGLRVGNGAIIAAGAVVTQNVKPMTLVAGVPAEVKRQWTQ